MKPLIITIAPTGNVPTKALNPAAPLTPEEIVADIKQCQAAGASIAHIHIRDNQMQPTCDRNIYKQVLSLVHEQVPDIIAQASTGARGGENTVAWRGQMLDLPFSMASLSTGSSNFPTSINANEPQLISELAHKMYSHNIKPEIEAFDLGMIDNAKFLLKKGILQAPLHFNLVMNVPGSIKGSPRNLINMVDSLPPDATWSVSGIGNAQLPMTTMAIIMGGHVRTGLEDILNYAPNQKATNLQLVERIVRLAHEFGRPIASVEDTKELLNLS